MKNKLEVIKLEIKTAAGKKVELTMAEAKELHDQLHELFGKKYVPSHPVVIERDRWWPQYYHFTTTATTPTYADNSSLSFPGFGEVAANHTFQINCDSGLQATYTTEECAVA